MIEAGQKLVARGVIEIEPPANPGAEGLQLRRAKSLGESRIAGEDDTEELFAIELFAGEDAELLEHGGEGFLGFVDDEHGAAPARGRYDRPIASEAP